MGIEFFSVYFNQGKSHQFPKNLELLVYTNSNTMDPIIEVELYPDDIILKKDLFGHFQDKVHA